jgi:hypothetical protein
MTTPPELPSSNDAAPPAPGAAASTSAVIDEDLLCLRCRRNLRGSLPTDRCPGCGIPVIHSVTFERRQLAVPPPRLRLAATFFCGDALVGIISAAMELIFYYLAVHERFEMLSTTISVIELVLAVVLFLPANFIIWQLARAESRRAGRAITYLAAMIGYLVSAILCMLLWLMLYGLYRHGSYELYMPLTVMMYVMGMGMTGCAGVMTIFAWLFLRDVARRPPYRVVRHWILPVFGMQVLFALAVVMEQVLWVYLMVNRTEGQTSLTTIIWHVTTLSHAVINGAALVMWVMVIVLAWRQWRAMRTQPAAVG